MFEITCNRAYAKGERYNNGSGASVLTTDAEDAARIYALMCADDSYPRAVELRRNGVLLVAFGVPRDVAIASMLRAWNERYQPKVRS